MSAVRRRSCGAPIRGFPGETCKLEVGHRRYHSFVVYTCEACGKVRRGQPHVVAADEPGGVPNMPFCFLCAGLPVLIGPKWGRR